MPSTNVNIGLLEGRSSCRVLKPPGGGHSDIFGRGDTIAEKPVPKKGSANMSGIQGCLYQSNDTINPKETGANGAGHAVSEEAEEANGKEKEVVDTATEAADDRKKKVLEPVAVVAPVPAVQKVRVPPGGFSSGAFW